MAAGILPASEGGILPPGPDDHDRTHNRPVVIQHSITFRERNSQLTIAARLEAGLTGGQDARRHIQEDRTFRPRDSLKLVHADLTCSLSLRNLRLIRCFTYFVAAGILPAREGGILPPGREIESFLHSVLPFIALDQHSGNVTHNQAIAARLEAGLTGGQDARRHIQEIGPSGLEIVPNWHMQILLALCPDEISV